MKTIMKRRAVFAEIHQDTRGTQQHIFSVKYRKKDGTIGFKPRCSKSFKKIPGAAGFKQNVSINHVLLLHDHDKNATFEILIDLFKEYNGYLIDHTT